MPEIHKSPRDLAQSVAREIKSGHKGAPELAVVQDLFSVLFFASLESEEGEPVQIHLVYLDPSQPDPSPPERIVNDRWSFIRLDTPIAFNVANLVKIAKASDPRTSALAVYPVDSGQIKIWGLTDQVNRFHDFLHYESRVGPEMPGMFQAIAIGVGHLVAFIGYRKVAELRSNKLITKSQDVLRKGPFRKLLEPSFDQYIKSIKAELSPVAFGDREHWPASLEDYWIATVCRLLLRTQSIGHGGAYLLTPDESLSGLTVNYRIKYDRLSEALRKRGVLLVDSTYASDQIHDQLDLDLDHISTGLYLDSAVGEASLRDSESEIEGALAFVSMLSRVDGVVVLDKKLTVRGFGVEIALENPINSIYVSAGPYASSGSLRKVEFHRFGTRHRSMMRYCSEVMGSLGFVVSQDGDVRAITSVDGKVVIWENLRLQPIDFIRRRPRKRRRNRRG